MIKKCVLICEDDEGIIEIARIVLEEKNYHVEAITNGNEILDKIKECEPGVILLDLWMPEISGDRVAGILRSNALTKHIPIVFVSASKDLARTAKESQVDAYLAKPFDIADLEDIVDKYMNNLS